MRDIGNCSWRSAYTVQASLAIPEKILFKRIDSLLERVFKKQAQGALTASINCGICWNYCGVVIWYSPNKYFSS